MIYIKGENRYIVTHQSIGTSLLARKLICESGMDNGLITYSLTPGATWRKIKIEIGKAFKRQQGVGSW